MSKSIITCVYLNVKNFKKSILFYTSLFQSEIERQFEDRWAQIKLNEKFTLGLLNVKYDKRIIEEGKDLKTHYNNAFIKNLPNKYTAGNTVVINLKADDLSAEYERIKKLNPTYISEIQYVNFMFPYNFFIIKDPDGNLIEIADA